MKKEAVTVHLYFKPANRRDENAIVVQVKFGQSGSEELYNLIGYIPGPKVSKVTSALRNNEVQVVTVKTFLSVCSTHQMILGSFHQLLF